MSNYRISGIRPIGYLAIQLTSATLLQMFLSTLPGRIDYDHVLVTTDRTLVNINLVVNNLPRPGSWWGAFTLYRKVAGLYKVA